jgi:hypothetical protein
MVPAMLVLSCKDTLLDKVQNLTSIYEDNNGFGATVLSSWWICLRHLIEIPVPTCFYRLTDVYVGSALIILGPTSEILSCTLRCIELHFRFDDSSII